MKISGGGLGCGLASLSRERSGDKAAIKAGPPRLGEAGKKTKGEKEEAEIGAEAGAEIETIEEKISGMTIQRYKGLGEMNPSQLWETTMDPTRRVLKQVKVADAKEADKVFDILMGDEVAPRKRFIQTHAKGVKNLDI